jgi:hypothetical protein
MIQYHYQKNALKYSSSTYSLLYTSENLTDADIAFFESLPLLPLPRFAIQSKGFD